MAPKVRAYRVTNGGQSWVMMGATTDPEQISAWLSEMEHHGVILHTGRAVLPREILVEIAPNAKGALVVCAATKAIYSDTLNFGQAEICHGLSDDTGALSLRDLGFWFFRVLPKHWAGGDGDLLLYPDSMVSQAAIEAFSADVEHLSIELKTALHDDNKLVSVVLRSGIYSIENFRENWATINPDQASQIASLIVRHGCDLWDQKLSSFNYGGRPLTAGSIDTKSLYIIHFSRYLPPWESALPTDFIRLFNALNALGLQALHALEAFSPPDIIKIPNMGQKSVSQLERHIKTIIEREGCRGSPSTPRSEKAHDECSGTKPAKSQDSPGISPSKPPSAYDDDLSKWPSFGQVISDVIAAIEQDPPRKAIARSLPVVSRRLQGDTLEAIGESMGVTRERVRQLEQIFWIHIGRKLKEYDPGPARNLFGLLLGIKQAGVSSTASFSDFKELVRILGPSDHFSPTVTTLRALNSANPINDFKFSLLSVGDDIEVFLPVPDSTPNDLDEQVEKLRSNLLDTVAGLSQDDAEQHALAGFSEVTGSRFSGSILAMDFVFYQLSLDENGRVEHSGKRISSEVAASEIVRVLRSFGRPMHAENEIFPAMPEHYRDKVNRKRLLGQIVDHQEKCPGRSPNFIFTMGRGTYALWEHLNVSDKVGSRASKAIEEHLADHPDRQFSDKELLNVLLDKDLAPWGKKKFNGVLSSHIVSAILMRYRPKKARYLGRWTWVHGEWTDQADTSARHQISDLIREALIQKGQPATRAEIVQFIDAARGRGIGDQFAVANGVVKLGGKGDKTLYWHEDMDPIPYDSAEAHSLRCEVIKIAKQSGDSGVSLHALKADIVSHSDVVGLFSTAQFLALILRMPEIQVSKGSNGQILVFPSTETANE